ncbi:gustatory receptor 172 [Tribolium castaneum]|uniref:Gustatory receptor n=1 Tax=Tribolium castaneum TaxID=7070 RepID=D6WBU3_TRICA|nr:gustatory receptor 172 [Tribolium castaneum]
MWHVTNISDLAKIIFIFWKFSGLPVFHSENSIGDRKNSYFFWLILFLQVAFCGLYMTFIVLPHNFNDYVGFLQLAVLYFHNFVLILHFWRKRKGLVFTFSKILVLERTVLYFTRKKLNCDKITKFLICYKALQFSVTLGVFISSLCLTTRTTEGIVFNLCNFLGSFLAFNFETLLLFFLSVLNELYLQFNCGLKRSLSYFQVLKVYFLLQEAINDVIKLLQIQLLLKVSSDWVITISTLFYVLKQLQNHSLPSENLLILVAVIWPAFILMSTFLMAFYCEKIEQQENTMANILTQVKIVPSYKRLNLLALRLEIKPIRFTIYELCPLNCTFINMMIVGMATYLIYLFQFSQMKQIG